MSVTPATIRSKLRRFILENFLFTDDDSELVDSASFLETGLVDSTGIMEVIFFLEEEFEIRVADDEMIPDNLDSIDNLVAYVSAKLSD